MDKTQLYAAGVEHLNASRAAPHGSAEFYYHEHMLSAVDRDLSAIHCREAGWPYSADENTKRAQAHRQRAQHYLALMESTSALAQAAE